MKQTKQTFGKLKDFFAVTIRIHSNFVKRTAKFSAYTNLSDPEPTRLQYFENIVAWLVWSDLGGKVILYKAKQHQKFAFIPGHVLYICTRKLIPRGNFGPISDLFNSLK